MVCLWSILGMVRFGKGCKKSETRFRSLRRLLYFEEKAPDKRSVFSSLPCKSSFVFSKLQIIWRLFFRGQYCNTDNIIISVVLCRSAWPYYWYAEPGFASTCFCRRRERKPPAAGTNPMTSCPSKRDPLVAPLLSSSVEGLKRFGSLLATPFRPPQGRPPFILPAR